MKKLSLLLVVVVATLSSYCQTPDAVSGATKSIASNGNSYYHRTEETSMEVGELVITGEVKNPGKVDLMDFYKREVFYKQALPNDSGKIDFVGAYRYSGYSLFDLLNGFIVDKKNKENFRPTTDLYVVVENEKGESVTFSWAEIFYTNIPHQVIIATESAPIEPYKCMVDYPTNIHWKLVAANDLYSYRILENPVKMTVKSFDKKDYPINRDLKNTRSLKVDVVINDHLAMTIDSSYQSTDMEEYQSVFYGMGMGYHPIPVFKGITLQSLIEPEMQGDAARWIEKGLVCFEGLDGYRVIYSFGELFNRTDQVEAILSIPDKTNDSGYYRIYHPGIFYGDMSAKSLAEIYIFIE